MKVKLLDIEREAIRKAAAETSQSELSRQSKVGQTSIGGYISGKNEKITDSNKSKLLPHIKKFLPESYQINNNHNNHNSVIHQNHYAQNQELEAYRKKLISTFTKTDKLDPETRLKVLDIINEL